MSLKDIFSNSIAFEMIKKYGKGGGVVQISTVFDSPYKLLPEGSYERRVFRNLTKNVFRSP